MDIQAAKFARADHVEVRHVRSGRTGTLGAQTDRFLGGRLRTLFRFGQGWVEADDVEAA